MGCEEIVGAGDVVGIRDGGWLSRVVDGARDGCIMEGIGARWIEGIIVGETVIVEGISDGAAENESIGDTVGVEAGATVVLEFGAKAGGDVVVTGTGDSMGALEGILGAKIVGAIVGTSCARHASWSATTRHVPSHMLLPRKQPEAASS